VVLSRLGVEVRDRIVAITLNHPPLNVIDIEMMEQLASTLADAEARDEIAVIVLNGSDRSFSVGVDVAAHTPEKVSEMLTKFHTVIRAVVGSRKIIVAAVRGHCLGGGAELAMVCDLVYTTDDATWGFPEIKLGCFPPVAAAALAALVGQKRAAELVLTGRSISGAEAGKIGLIKTSAHKEREDSQENCAQDGPGEDANLRIRCGGHSNRTPRFLLKALGRGARVRVLGEELIELLLRDDMELALHIIV